MATPEIYTHLQLFALFFFNDTATTEIYTLSLHDALPISIARSRSSSDRSAITRTTCGVTLAPPGSGAPRPRPRSTRRGRGSPIVGPFAQALADRKSTRLNSSHSQISYAVFCLKKKKENTHSMAHHCTQYRDRRLSHVECFE